MTLKPLSDTVFVAAQILPQDVMEAKANNVELIICNRPDGEEPGQVTVDAIRQAAKDAGIEFRHIPIHSGQFTDAAVDEFREALLEGKTTLAYCRSGTRSAALWALAKNGDLPADAILDATQQAGYDFAALRPRLQS